MLKSNQVNYDTHGQVFTENDLYLGTSKRIKSLIDPDSNFGFTGADSFGITLGNIVPLEISPISIFLGSPGTDFDFKYIGYTYLHNCVLIFFARLCSSFEKCRYKTRR